MGALVGAFHIRELSLHVGTSSHLPLSSRVVLGGLPRGHRAAPGPASTLGQPELLPLG